jgi:transcriptional regulator with GAF, ATPase, and Fis domain
MDNDLAHHEAFDGLMDEILALFANSTGPEVALREALEEVKRLTARLRAENTYLRKEITGSQGFDEIVGESELLRGVLAKIEHVARTDASVLLLGETGTGKELFARAVHDRGPRKDRPMVKVNLAALPSSLIESELFGHVKGAFTGAVSDKVGRFDLADGGTLFLDEIGELDPELQMKLLRVLQEGEFERIGSAETTRVDVRIVAATNRDLRAGIDQGRFRPDLYYRLAVFPIEVPPLRLRRDDIPLLVWHFIAKKRARLAKTIDSIPNGVMADLVRYDWPGNVRELENTIERAMILSPHSTLVLAERLIPAEQAKSDAASFRREDIDRDRVIAVLDDCGWRIKGAGNAADRLGVKPSTLRYRMKASGIRRPEAVKPR